MDLFRIVPASLKTDLEQIVLAFLEMYRDQIVPDSQQMDLEQIVLGFQQIVPGFPEMVLFPPTITMIT